ncbi:MAG: NUDIX domain-containing protein [Candidatus Omnitrophota bacterium]
MIRVRNINISVVKGDIELFEKAAGPMAVNEALFTSSWVDEFTVRNACAKALEQAEGGCLSSIVLPLFGVGKGGFPVMGCAKIMSQELLRVAREAGPQASLKEIIICVPSDELLMLVEKQVYGYLKHVTEDLAWGPYVCADIIIEMDEGIILIERTNPPFGWALPGGFVDRGESLETAAAREAREETNMNLKDLKQFHTYSEPSRDPRFHTITTIFTAKGIGTPKAGDDAKGLKIVPLSQLRQLHFAFDHNKVLNDYLVSRGL